MEYVNEKLQEFNNYIKNKKVAIIGLGVSNLPLIEYLYNLESIKVKYMGKNGKITLLNTMIKDVPNDQKKEFGIIYVLYH